LKKEIIEIESPEKITFHYKIALTGTRIAAFTIDFFIQVGITALLVILIMSAAAGNPFSFYEEESATYYMIAFYYLVTFFLQWGYFILFEAIMNGQTPGKRMMGIRVIKENGEPVDFSTIVLRNLIRVVDFFPFYNMLGGVVTLIDTKSRRLGDIVANTVVVNTLKFNFKEPDFLIQFSTYTDEWRKEELNKQILSKLNEEQLYILRRYLNKRNRLPPHKRYELSNMIALDLKKRLNIKGDIGNPEEFIELIYQAHSYYDKE
jgi:uncharacterized RDD family membrane protein YckC